MTHREALIGALVTGAVSPDDAARHKAADWWDDDCADVLVAVEALSELGIGRTPVELAKCLVALGYGAQEAATRAIEAEAWGRRVGFASPFVRALRGAA